MPATCPQRMQMVTTQISERVEHLMDVQREANARAAEPARTAAAAPPASPATTAPAESGIAVVR